MTESAPVQNALLPSISKEETLQERQNSQDNELSVKMRRWLSAGLP